MLINDFIENIIKFRNNLLNRKVKNLEYEISIFFIYLVDTIKYLIKSRNCLDLRCAIFHSDFENSHFNLLTFAKTI